MIGGNLRERAHMMRDTSGNDNLNDKWGWMAPLTPSNAHTLEGLATAVSRLNTRSYSLRLAPLRFISYPTSRRSMYRADARGRHAARGRLPRNKTALSPPPVKKRRQNAMAVSVEKITTKHDTQKDAYLAANTAPASPPSKSGGDPL